MIESVDHHAQLVRVADPVTYIAKVTTCEQSVYRYDSLGIAEVRTIQRQALVRPATDIKQQLVICARTLTIEAQNALLKLFEEPPVSTLFVLVVPTGLQLVPTVLSRVHQVTDLSSVDVPESWSLFLGVSVKDRLAQVTAWQKKKDADWLQAIQTGYIAWLGEAEPTPTPMLRLVAERLGTRGASNKLLLEALALELPVQ